MRNDMEALTIYMLLGCILSVIMYMTSKTKLPIMREVKCHVAIALLWPLVLANIVRITLGSGDSKD